MPQPPGRPSDPTHLDAEGRARMVDVSDKAATVRTARAEALVRLTPDLRERVLQGRLPKGEALAVARIAGIQAAKETSRLIPLCHPLPLGHVGVEFLAEGDDAIAVRTEARTTAATGVEMEALCAAAVAALTLYDMVKSVHRGAVVERVRLLHKSGGRSGAWDREVSP